MNKPKRTMACPRHIPTLDGLRGLAALAVVWHHFPQVGDSRPAVIVRELSQKTLSGPLAVDIFFVLSGFLITRIILREIAAGQFSVRNFVIKRGLRIFPIYYLTLLILACWQPISQQWVAAACYVSNYTIPFDTSPHMLGHTWSLAVEEQFYLIWPLLFAILPVTLVRRVAWPWGPVVALLTAGATFLLLETPLSWALVYRGLPFRMLSLLLGATFAFHEETIRRWPRRLVGPGAVVSYVGLLLTALGVQQTGWPGFHWLSVLLSAGTSMLIVQIVVCANEWANPLRRLLTSAPLLWAGQISYGIYLYHNVILFLFLDPGEAASPSLVFSVNEAILFLLLCFVIPYASYLVIERPFLRLKTILTTTPAEFAVGGRLGREVGKARTRPTYPAAWRWLLQSMHSAGRNVVAFARIPLLGNRRSVLPTDRQSRRTGDVDNKVASTSSHQPNVRP